MEIPNREVSKEGGKGIMFTSSPLKMRNSPCSSQNDVIGTVITKGKTKIPTGEVTCPMYI